MCQGSRTSGRLWLWGAVVAVLVTGLGRGAVAQAAAQKAPSAMQKVKAVEEPASRLRQASSGPAAENMELLRLARELKADVDKTSKNVLSLDVIRKAQQIEQYARKIQREMAPNR